MMTRQAMAPQSMAERGSVAVVTYLPDPMGAFLTALRQGINPDHNPDAHITFLPPRLLSVAVETASVQVAQILRSVEPFEVELGRVNVFPQTNMLYLDISSGYQSLLSLHAALNEGSLFAQENFEFTPHLTLSGPLSTTDVDTALERAQTEWDASHLPRRFVIDEAILLWQSATVAESSWMRLNSYRLLKPNGAAGPSPAS